MIGSLVDRKAVINFTAKYKYMKIQNILLGTAFLLLTVPSMAQDKKLSKKELKALAEHVNHFKTPDEISTDEVAITIKDPIARMDQAKFRAKVINNTEDFILWDLSKASIEIAGQSLSTTKSKRMIIKPFKDESKTLEVRGSDLHVESYSANLGKFSRVPLKGNVQQADDFALPASQNSFSTGPFTCNMTSISKKTDLTAAKFECTYKGGSFGIIDPSKVAVRMSNGQEFANSMRKEKMHLLERGEKKKFTLYFEVPAKVEDMQFANMEIVWNACLVESKAVPAEVPMVKFEFDPGKTAGKN